MNRNVRAIHYKKEKPKPVPNWKRLLILFAILAACLLKLGVVEVLYRVKKSPAWTNYDQSNSKLADNTILAMESDEKGNVFIGTRNGFTVIGADDSWKTYTPDTTDLMGRRVYAIAIDHLDRIWVGTETGLSMLDQERIWRSYGAAEFGSQTAVNALALDALGRLWIGSDIGLFLIDDSGVLTNHFNGISLPPIDHVTALMVDHYDRVWVGSEQSLGILNPTGEWKTFEEDDLDITLRDVRSIVMDSKNNVWVRFSRSGRWIGKYDTGNEWKVYALHEPTFGNDSPMSIIIDAEDRIWAGYGGGLRFMDESGLWVTYTPLNSGMGHYVPNILTIDAEGCLWVGSQDANSVVVRDFIELNGLEGVSVWNLTEGLPNTAPRGLINLRQVLTSPIRTSTFVVESAYAYMEIEPDFFGVLGVLITLSLVSLGLSLVRLIVLPIRSSWIIFFVLLTVMTALMCFFIFSTFVYSTLHT